MCVMCVYMYNMDTSYSLLKITNVLLLYLKKSIWKNEIINTEKKYSNKPSCIEFSFLL